MLRSFAVTLGMLRELLQELRGREDIPKMERRTCNQKEYDRAATCKNSTQKAEGSDLLMLVKTNGNFRSYFSSGGEERITRRDSLDRLPPWGHSAYLCLKMRRTSIN